MSEESAHQEDKREQEPDHVSVAPTSGVGWEQGSQTPTAGSVPPSRAPQSCPAIVWESISLLGFVLFTEASPARQDPVSVL